MEKVPTIDGRVNYTENITEKVEFLFLMFTLIEEFINPDIGSISSIMYSIFHKYHGILEQKITKKSVDKSIAPDLPKFFQILNNIERNVNFSNTINIDESNDYKIFEISREQHSMKIIIKNNKILLVNSGLGINFNDDRIYLHGEMKNKIFLLDLNNNWKLRTIEQIYAHVKENINVIDIYDFETTHCNKQLAGSCTYFSTLYSIYYILYDSFQNDKYVIFYKNELKNVVLDIIKESNYTFADKYVMIQLEKCLDVIDEKYNIEKKRKNLITHEKFTFKPIEININKSNNSHDKNQEKIYDNIILKLNNKYNDQNDLIVLNYFLSSRDKISFDFYFPKINKSINILHFIYFLSTDYNDAFLLPLYILKYIDDFDFTLDHEYFNKFIYILNIKIYDFLMITGKSSYRYQIPVNQESIFGYIFLIIFELIDYYIETKKLSYSIEKTNYRDGDYGKVDLNNNYFYFAENSSYIRASYLMNKYEDIINMNYGDNLFLQEMLINDFSSILNIIFGKKIYYSSDYIDKSAIKKIQISESEDNGFSIKTRTVQFVEDVYIYINYYHYNIYQYFKKNFLYVFNEDNELKILINYLEKENISGYKILYLNIDGFDNTSDIIYDRRKPYDLYCYLGGNPNMHNIIEEYNKDRQEKIKNKQQTISWINPFHLSVDVNDKEKFDFIVSNINYLFNPKEIQWNSLLDNNYININGNDKNFYFINKVIFRSNIINIDLEKKFYDKEINPKNLFIIYMYYLFFDLDQDKNLFEFQLFDKNIKFIKNKLHILFSAEKSLSHYNILLEKNIDIQLYNTYLFNSTSLIFVDFIILRKILSKKIDLFKKLNNIYKKNKNLKISNNPDYSLEYTQNNVTYYTDLSLINEMFDIGAEDYIKYYNPDDKKYYYFSPVFPELKKNNDDGGLYYFHNNEQYKFIKKNLMMLSDKSHLLSTKFGMRYLEFVNNYTFSNAEKNIKKIFYNYFEYDTNEIYFETYNNNICYLFDDIEPLDLLYNYDNNADIILTQKKLFIFLNFDKVDVDKITIYEPLFNVNKITSNFREILDTKKNYYNVNYYFEYNITIDEKTNKILDIELLSKTKAQIIFYYLNKNHDYELMMKLLNKFISLLDFDYVCANLNHPYYSVFNNLKSQILYSNVVNFTLKDKLVHDLYLKENKNMFNSSIILDHYLKKGKKITNDYFDNTFILNKSKNSKFEYKPDQKNYIDNMIKYIGDANNKNHPTYEIIMGFGKSSVIIPYTTLHTLLFNNIYDQIIIIAPVNLINEMYVNLLENVSNLPLCNISKQTEYTNSVRKFYINNIKKGIIICSDVTMKYQLISNIINVNDNVKRLFMIDEIDDCINPLKSNFNLKMDDSKIENELMGKINIDKFFEFIIEYSKNIFSLDNAEEILFKIYGDTNFTDQIKCFFKNSENCDIEIQEKDIFYLLKKIYDSTSILKSKKYIKNRHYGFDVLSNNERYFYAVPYESINKPSQNSEFNDIFTLLILTINLYIDNFSFRDKDIHKIANYIERKQSLNAVERKMMKIYYTYNDNDNINYKNLDYFNESIFTEKNELISIYLKHVILPNTKFTKKHKNTSFIELLNPFIVDKYIGFSGTTEYISKINDKYPMINGKEITNVIENKNKKADYNAVKHFFSKIKYIEFLEDDISNICSYINDNKHIKSIIDNACILRFNSMLIYSKEILNNCHHIDYILYFDENDELMKIKRNLEITKENKRKENRELDLMMNDKFLVIFDERHTRGTDISLPLNTHSICTISYISDYVNVMQAIFRLRKIGNGQTVEFIVNEKLKKSINKTSNDLLSYLNKRTKEYIKEQEKELLIQTISANIKFILKFNNKYYDNDDIITYLIPLNLDNNIQKLLNKNYNLENIYNYLCNKTKDQNTHNREKVYMNYCNLLNTNYILLSNVHYDISTSVNFGTNEEVEKQINISINKDINITLSQYDIQKNNFLYKDKSKKNETNEWLEIYDYNGVKQSYFSFYSYAYLKNEIDVFLKKNQIFMSGGTYSNKSKHKFIKYYLKNKNII